MGMQEGTNHACDSVSLLPHAAVALSDHSGEVETGDVALSHVRERADCR